MFFTCFSGNITLSLVSYQRHKKEVIKCLFSMDFSNRKVTHNQIIKNGGKSNDSRFARTARSLQCSISSDN